MTISYKWLSTYLPVPIPPDKLSEILTSVGLEVEKMETFEEVKGGLKGLVIGEVLEVEQHPNADKLKLTRVRTGAGEPLQIVCGAPNVAAGQKVVVAPVGTTIHPLKGDPVTMKTAKIRGIESQGMICAEDEIGLGESHAGIMVLPESLKPGTDASDYFQPFNDIIYEIGLTPNRMDAMSHWGVARDVCAYLSHHEQKELKPVYPVSDFQEGSKDLPIEVTIEDAQGCKRYSGICLDHVQVKESPRWLQERLKSIGLRPINNIVDITNFIQHETGQPLHAFDYDKIAGARVIVKSVAPGTSFLTLDEKERKLDSEDLMICDAEKPMCIAGVFGGANSGVTETTSRIFLESAWFDPIRIRKTSFRHGLRTDAASRFEKGIDISGTVNVLKRAASLMKDVAGARPASSLIDIYPEPQPKVQVALEYAYLNRLSGKSYPAKSVKSILTSLGFSIPKEGPDVLVVEVPYHKPDVSLPADLAEEILRIDGLDNIEIPGSIMISPAVEKNYKPEIWKEKISNLLTGAGYSEILTNSITNAAYFDDETLQNSVRLLNNLSSELNMMRPSMLPTALDVIAFNVNRKNESLRFFEFGKTYSQSAPGKYSEQNRLCLYTTGPSAAGWKSRGHNSDLYQLKGLVEALMRLLGIDFQFSAAASKEYDTALQLEAQGRILGVIGKVTARFEKKFDLRQPVYVADLDWDALMKKVPSSVGFREIPKFPAVERDLAMVVPRAMPYAKVKEQITGLRLNKLREVRLFDIFESEKLGKDKKSLAINLVFQDPEKTLTDKEIDGWMNRIMITLEKELQAEIRK